ncbi:B-cell receptor CD22-like [Salvelinus fontinalis]|uniref:B-cell receptor CD22-like n=1 Tax=Salvelinus fontinalis TaxID=8038 RepID=UPI00248544F9|nr:B-cell receptor CD22-like [Salvelinus fontinalis]
MALRTAGSVLVVFLWSVAVVLGQDGWSVTYTPQRICALRGSTVDLSCSYTYPSGTVTKTRWFTEWGTGVEPKYLGQDPENAGHVKYRGDKEKDCTLRITDLRERDSATYRFRLQTDQEGGTYTGQLGVTLSVTGLQVKVTGGHQDKTLTCSTTCTLTDNPIPNCIWYKNGKHLDESTSPQYKNLVSSNYIDGYSCAVKGHEDLHSPAVCVQGQSCNRVTYTKRRICVLEGSTVDISCTYVGYYTVKSSLWFSPKRSTSWTNKLTPEDLTRDPGYAGRVQYTGRETGTYEGPSSLRITDLREEDSAEYRFTFKTDNFEWGHSFPGTTLSVTGLQVKVTPAAEGQKTLTCITTCTLTDNPTYIWYKNGQRLDEPTSLQYSVNSYYSDSYSCAVKEVSWFNKWKSGVTKDLIQDSEYASRVEYHRQTEKDSTLRITDLRESDSTEYKFRFTTDEARWGYSIPGTTLTVTGFQVKVTPEQYSEYKTLTCITTCTLSNPNPIYIWYKNGQHLEESNSTQYKDPVSSNSKDSYSCAVKGHEDLHSPAVCVHDPGYAGRVEYTGTYKGPFTLRISDLREEDSAEYRFTFKTHNFEWGHSFPGTTLSVTGLLVKVTPTAEGQKTLTCSTTCTLTDNPTYIWYKNGKRLDEPTSQQYSNAPKNTSVSVSPSGEIVEGSSVTLNCSSDANPPVDKYTWYKKNGASLTGSENTFLITNISSEDRGEYYCEAESIYGSLNSSSVSVDIQYGPKNTSVSVSPSGEIVEGSSVTLTCSSDANPPVHKYTWYKKNVASPKASGQSYSITNISSEDRGEYYCEAENTIASKNSTALKIIVAGKQTSVLTAAVGIIVVVLVLILCFSGLMWFRKKASKSTSDPKVTADDGQGDASPVYDSISGMVMIPTAAQTAATDDQDDVHYASVHFSRSKNQEVPLCSTVQVPVLYAALKFNLPVLPPAAPAAEEDSSVLYSTVNKP